jgi:hypothetical protein
MSYLLDEAMTVPAGDIDTDADIKTAEQKRKVAWHRSLHG